MNNQALVKESGSLNSIQDVDWRAIQSQFSLSKEWVHLAQMYLTSHPQKVKDAIEFYKYKLDKNPVHYVAENFRTYDEAVAGAAGEYLQCIPGAIALTDSTTMGLSILYHGLRLNPGDEILTTTHGHYSCIIPLELAAKRSKASVQKIELYQDSSEASTEELVNKLINAIRPKTRFVAITYVHSSTGIKLPIQQIANEIKKINLSRNSSDRIYLCVDAVHAFGIENFNIEELGCDFLIAGTHKWLFGPRGTGILYAKEEVWDLVDPIIPPYSIASSRWRGESPPGPINFLQKITPGGFHSYEYRWALKEAFEYHLEIGKENIQNRTHYLNTLLKEGLMEIPHLILHTPLSQELSSGIVCFEIKGMGQKEVVKKLRDARIIGTTTPYRRSFARLTPSILNTEEDIFRSIHVLENILP